MSFVLPFGPSQLMLEAPKSARLALPRGNPTKLSDADLLEELSAQLDGVDAALARLDDGSFDSCELCGSRIGPDRLLDNPLLTRCLPHSPR